MRPSRQMKRISVSKSPTFTGQVREVFHQDTPAHGRHLAAHLIESLPSCPIPEIARLGRTLRKWKDAFLAYFDTGGANNAPHRSHQRNHRTRQTHRQRLPQPHQLQTPNAPHRRRPRRLHPHSTMKSPSTESASMMNGSTSARVAPPVSTSTCSQRDADRGVGAHLATNGGISRARRLDHSR